ncbi:MAG: SURF1 family protein [Thiolinea sp.]
MVKVKTAVLATLYCLGLVLLLGLGTWQINRGLHKGNVLSLVGNKHKDYQVLTELPANPESLNYQKATLSGHWDTQHYFLLDNRINEGQLGYEIIMPFQLSNGQNILVNRGWIARNQAATLHIPTTEQLNGTLYLPKKGYTIGESIPAQQQADDSWPKVTLYMDLQTFSSVLKQPLSPLLLVLEQTHPDSLTQIWKPVVIAPERHYAYALQWYGLAIVFIIFGVIWYRRANPTNQD